LKAAIMIESFMFFAIGFLLAGIGVVVVAPLIHGRAVRLTKRQLEASIPLSMAEVQADKDLLRAEFAMSTRRLETNFEQLRTKNARQLAELGRKDDAINRLNIELGALRDQLPASEAEFAVKVAAMREAECALSEREAELAKRIGELNERSTSADAHKIEVVALKAQAETLKAQLDEASNELKMLYDGNDAAVYEARCALSEKETELTNRLIELDDRSSIADAQKIEINKLNTQVEELKQRLAGASNELKAVENRRDADRIELKTVTQKLMEERSKFENFHCRVGKLVQQLMAQSSQDKNLSNRAQELENRLIAQSRVLREREQKLKNLHSEIETARKAEADLRSKIEAHVDVATDTLKAENAKLQAAFDRANGERVRLAYELANIKRQIDEVRAAEQIEGPLPSNVAVGVAAQVAYGRLPRRANSKPVTLGTGHEDQVIHRSPV
jgi:chromosome segregation ATPase